MGSTLRESLNWLHTWTGVVVGVLLFAVFWTGTLCVFDREIDRWMMPSTRLTYSGAPVSIDPLREQAAAFMPKDAPWTIVMPTPREPFVWIGYRVASGIERKLFDPVTLAPLKDPESWAATRFFFPLHYTLHIQAWDIGLWLVGFAGMAMLALCVSGVIIHRRIFTDFFTIRRSRQSQRFLLDLHNTAGVLGFIFYVVMAFSGVTIFASTYFPAGVAAAFEGGTRGYVRETYDMYMRPRSGKPAGPQASLDAMAAKAREEWGGLPVNLVRIWNEGDANAVVEVRPSIEGEITMRTDPLYFDAATGRVLHRTTIRPMTEVQQFLTGLHFAQFHHWTIRWIYFLLGALGCMLIATGLLFWVESRRKSHEASGLPGVRLVEGLAAGGTAGMIIATLAFFVANRLLPSGATLFGYARYQLEIWAFFAAWLACFAWGWWMPRRAWTDFCKTVVGMAVAAVLLNAVTTGDNPIRSIMRHDWPVAGMDMVLLVGAASAAVAAHRLGRRRAAASRHNYIPQERSSP